MPPTDFHELIIQVNSVPVSPSNLVGSPSTITAPPRIHVHNPQATRTPPPVSRPVFESPSRHQSPHPNTTSQEDYYRPQDPRAPSPPDLNRTVSPAFSTSPTLVRANSSATQGRSMSPQENIPMRSMFPVYDPTVPLTRQAYKPTETSPTHIPRTQISRLPYAPDNYVPYGNLNTNGRTVPTAPKTFFTPSGLLDNLWLATNGQEEPVVQIYTLKMHRATAANPTITFGTTPSLPFYSLAQSNLAGGGEVPSIMNELLIQRHHPTQPRVLPIAHLDLIAPPSLDNVTFDPQEQASTTLLTNIYPKLAALQALDAAANSPAASHIAITDPGAQSPAAQQLAEDVLAGAAQRECCVLAWTRDAPEQQTNPWAHHMPSEGSYQLHHPTLGTFPIQMEGDCSVINKPSTRPITAIYGHNMRATPQSPGRTASITLLNPFILSPTSPRANDFSPLAPPPRLDSQNRPISITPSEMSVGQLPTTTDATADDAMLARLDFANDALTLNLGALAHFGNPFLVDVVASTLLAVAVAEATRGRRSRNNSRDDFEPPPPSYLLTHKKEDTAGAFKQSFVEGFQGFGGKAKGPVSGSGFRKFASSLKSSTTSTTTSTTCDKDIELGEWYGQAKTKIKEKRDNKKADGASKLPFVARAIIGIITFSFKAVIWILRIAIKIVAGVFVMITRNFGKL
ncbi:hypothetical protein P153DRAFT_331657 [Dothidotthia symphoricarpi CBS 119687]|uniref:Uncharacterized protein n=1 Tax=Dothidotthia symphoricarpi CBS 119687 TaxID=1392245 RepID=A0A6A6APU0_9PLEO|nr:uncharacterized protein P153DRAFT_331657 [Dothidotthia symphoricarpi CBS 119687]KAF2133178.1 hypothetical protein P153DRAFT_331657 [Dothidotthia symphoricarpi CBS 119687]